MARERPQPTPGSVERQVEPKPPVAAGSTSRGAGTTEKIVDIQVGKGNRVATKKALTERAEKRPRRRPTASTSPNARTVANPTAEPRGDEQQMFVDGDGDQGKELRLLFRAVETWPSGSVKALGVRVVQRSSGQVRAFTFTFPEQSSEKLVLEPTVRMNVTDGFSATRIYPFSQLRPYALELGPGAHSRDRSAYSLTINGQSFDAVFPRERTPLERVGEASPTTDVGGVHYVDLRLGAFKDQFRLSFRKTGVSTATFGIHAVNGGEPTGAAGVELIDLEGPLAPRVLPSAPTSVAIDLDGDGKADLFLYDQLVGIPRGYDRGGGPERDRHHRIRVRGPVKTGEVLLDFDITRGRTAPNRELDDHGKAAVRDVASRDRIARQRPEAAPAAVANADNHVARGYLDAAERGNIPRPLAEAFDLLATAVRMLPVRPDLAGQAVEAASAFDKVFRETMSGFARENSHYLASRLRSHTTYAPVAPSIEKAIKNEDWAAARGLLRRAIVNLDHLVVAGARFGKGTVPPGTDANAMQDELDHRNRRRDALLDMPKNAKRVPATFHPADKYAGEEGYKQAYDYELYVWNDGKKWHLRDLMNPADVKTVTEKADPEETEPPRSLFAQYDDPDYFPEGRLRYRIGDGQIREQKMSGGVSWKTWLSRIGTAALILGTIAAAPAVLTGATMTLTAIRLFHISSYLGAARATIDLTKRYQHGNLDAVTTVIDVAGIVSGMAHGTGHVMKLGVDKVARAGTAPITAGVAHAAQLANRTLIPTAGRVEMGMDGVSFIALTPLGVKRWEQLNANRPKGDDTASRVELLTILLGSGAALLFVYKGGAAWATSGNAYKGDLNLVRRPDGLYELASQAAPRAGGGGLAN